MKIRDDEINELKISFQTERLQSEIHQRDNEIDKLRNEIAALKSQHNQQMDELKEAFKLETGVLYNKIYQRDMELDILKERTTSKITALKIENDAIQNRNRFEKKILEKKMATAVGKEKLKSDRRLAEEKNKFLVDVNVVKLDAAKKVEQDLQYHKQLRSAAEERVKNLRAEVNKQKKGYERVYENLLMATFDRLGCRVTWELIEDFNCKFNYGIRGFGFIGAFKPEEGDIIQIDGRQFKVCAGCYSDAKKCDYLTTCNCHFNLCSMKK